MGTTKKTAVAAEPDLNENTTVTAENEGDTQGEYIDYKAEFEQLMQTVKAQGEQIAKLMAAKITPKENKLAEEQDVLARVIAANKASEEYVDLYIDKGSKKSNKNFELAVDGVQYVIPKGETVRVPRKVAEVYYNSVKQTEFADEKQAKTSEAAVEELRKYDML